MPLIIARLPPGSQGAVRDVSEAYRRIPIAPSQWPGYCCPPYRRSVAVNVALLFGLVSSGGIWGLVADALCAILRASGTYFLHSSHTSVIPHSYYYTLQVLVLFVNGWTTSSSSESSCIPSPNTIFDRISGPAQIRTQGGRRQTNSRIWFAGGILPDGSEEEFDNDLSFPIFNNLLLAQPLSLLTTLKILMPSQTHWEYPGRRKKINLSPIALFTSASIGIFLRAELEFQIRRKRSTEMLSSFGLTLNLPFMHSKETQEHHGKLPTPLLKLFQLEEHTSRRSNFSCHLSVIVLTCHVDHHAHVDRDLRWWLEQLERPCVERDIPRSSSTH